MIKQLQKKQKIKDAELFIFLIFFLGMALYYGWRLFSLTPWYDELYTYYYFISRGPVYAAIHWPLPNNHVGYSVISAFFDLFGNAAIGLRGVSWICSLISLYLLFLIGKKCFPKGFAIVPCCLFASMELVNQLAVQGRGYALSTCLYLTAVYELLLLIKEKDCRIRNYIILACAFIWALYTLPSSVYFVIPLCVMGGLILLLGKRKREFVQLFVTALISAVCTVGLYAIIWLAIGSNLLSKTSDSSFYGQGHINIILHAPFFALQTGIEYMLDTPYIQSVARKGYLSRFGTWIKVLFEYYYSGLSVLLIAVVCIGIIAVICRLFITGKNNSKALENTEKYFLEWYLFLSFVLTPLMLIIQAKLPYYRVFSFFGIPVALMITWLFVRVVAFSRKPGLAYGVSLFAGLLCIMLLALPSSRAQYSDREAAIEDAYAHMSLDAEETVCVTDCDQEYLMKYLYDREDVCLTVEEADYVLFDRDLLLTEEEMKSFDTAGADIWKFYITWEEIPRDYLENEMDVCYENDRFVLYKKKSN